MARKWQHMLDMSAPRTEPSRTLTLTLTRTRTRTLTVTVTVALALTLRLTRTLTLILARIRIRTLTRSAPHTAARWGVSALVMITYAVRVYLINGDP